MMRKRFRDILTQLEGWCLRELTRDTYRGIRLCDINHDETDDSAFLAKTTEALDLIAQVDPRRFRRVQKEIRFIVNKEINALGQYRKSTRCCLVDFGRLPFEEHAEWYLLLYAGMIVHEATHGVLEDRGHGYSPATREQIERICHAEEYRFLNRARPEWRDYLKDEFDPSRWHFSWHASRWQKLRARFQRVNESKRKANNRMHVIAAERGKT